MYGWSPKPDPNMGQKNTMRKTHVEVLSRTNAWLTASIANFALNLKTRARHCGSDATKSIRRTRPGKPAHTSDMHTSRYVTRWNAAKCSKYEYSDTQHTYTRAHTTITHFLNMLSKAAERMPIRLPQMSNERARSDAP